MCLCACVHAHVHVSVCVYACVCMCVWTQVWEGTWSQCMPVVCPHICTVVVNLDSWLQVPRKAVPTPSPTFLENVRYVCLFLWQYSLLPQSFTSLTVSRSLWFALYVCLSVCLCFLLSLSAFLSACLSLSLNPGHQHKHLWTAFSWVFFSKFEDRWKCYQTWGVSSLWGVAVEVVEPWLFVFGSKYYWTGLVARCD